MSSTYGGNNVFPSLVTLPSDGEPQVVASVNVPLEGIADRTVYLKTRADSYDGNVIRNLRIPSVADTVASGYDFSFHRADGTSQAFWAECFQFWIKCGNSTAGRIYIGDNNFFQRFNTGATTPPTVSFGCASVRACLFDSTLRTTGGGVDLKYIQGPAGGSDFSGTWTTKTLDTIVSFLSYVRAGDAVVTPTGRQIVCGGGDLSGAGQFLIWKSDDDGTTFTRVTVGNVSASQDFLSRVIVGKTPGGAGTRLVAWVKQSSLNQGNKLFYSDDNGNTWSSRSAIGFDNITDGVYLPDLDLWAFTSSTGTNIYTTPDPVLGAFTTVNVSFPVETLGGFGHFLVFALTVGSTWHDVYLSTDGLATTQFVGRQPADGAAYCNVAASSHNQVLLSSGGALTLSERV